MQTRHANTRIRTENVLTVKKDNLLSHSRNSVKIASKRASSALHPAHQLTKHVFVPKSASDLSDNYLSADELQILKAFRRQRSELRSHYSNPGSHLACELFERVDCGEFQEQNFDYLQDRELNAFPLVKNFIELKSHDINSRMRYIVINWLVDVHKSYQLTPESLYLTVALMDRFIHRTNTHIKKDQFQLLGLTALYVAAKFEEIFPPEITDFVAISDNSVTKEQIKQAEKDLLKTLNFNLGFSSPIVFLRRLTSALNAAHVMHNLAKYLLELSITEYDIAHLSGNIKASMAVCLARALCQECDDLTLIWTDELVFLTGLKLEDFLEDLKVLARAAFRQNSPSRYRAIMLKYSESEALGKVSKLPILCSDLLAKIGCVCFEDE